MRNRNQLFVGVGIALVALLWTAAWGYNKTYSQVQSPITPTPSPTAALAGSSFTLVGQLIPAVNTGPDAGVGTSYGQPYRALYPVEYHLYDAQNDQIKVTFDNLALTSVPWQQWLDTQLPVNRKAIIADATAQSVQTPDVSHLSWTLMPHLDFEHG